MSSLADACTNIIIQNFNDIYLHLKKDLVPDQICLLAGTCSVIYHQHNNAVIQITPLSELGKVDPTYDTKYQFHSFIIIINRNFFQ